MTQGPLQAPMGFSPNRFGRKSMLSWCCLQVALANTSAIFAPNFLVYCGLRFLNAFGLAGIILTSTTLSESPARPPPARGGGEGGAQGHHSGPHLPPPRLSVVEWTTTRRRAVTMTVLGCTYCTGQMVLGGLAFALRDWRALHLATSAPFFAIFLISL